MCEPYVGRGRGDNERGVPSLGTRARIENGREKFAENEDETEVGCPRSRHKCEVEECDR